jgi:hypothetical protein
VEVPIVPYEYLFHPPSSVRLGHPLNEGLRGYYRDNLPQVQWVTGYGLKTLDTIDFLQRQMAGEPYTTYQEMAPPLQAEEEGLPT